MNKMKNVITLRLSTHDMVLLDKMSRREKRDRSTTLRELFIKGRTYLAVEKYTTGLVSIEKAAEIAGTSLAEMMELLRKLGIESKLSLSDYLAGEKAAEKLI